VSVGGTLLRRADFRQTPAKRFGEALLNFRRDESDAVKVLNAASTRIVRIQEHIDPAT